MGGDQSATQSQAPTVVEHVCFFKVKDGPQTEEAFREVQGLKHLDCVSELTVGKVSQILGPSYGYVLHSRHLNKAALDAYFVDPDHHVIEKVVAPYIEDKLVVDWETVPLGPPMKGGRGVLRIAFIKLADGVTEEETPEVLVLLRGLRDKFPSIRQISTGENFSARSKGFNLGFVAMFDNLEEADQLNGNAALQAELREGKIAQFVSDLVIADVDARYD